MSSSRATRAKSAAAALANAMVNGSVGRLGPNYSVLAGMRPRRPNQSGKARKLPRAVINAIHATTRKYGKPPKTKGMRVQTYPALQRMRRAAAANLSRRIGTAVRKAHENANFQAAIKEEERRIIKEERERELAKIRRLRKNFRGRPVNDAPADKNVNALNALFGKL